MTFDKRIPVWQGIVKGKTVRIYDWEAYHQSKLDYPDTPEELARVVREKPQFVQKKKEARYNWISPIGTALKGRVS